MATFECGDAFQAVPLSSAADVEGGKQSSQPASAIDCIEQGRRLRSHLWSGQSTTSLAKANFARFYGLPVEKVSLGEIANSSAGVGGWAAARLRHPQLAGQLPSTAAETRQMQPAPALPQTTLPFKRVALGDITNLMAGDRVKAFATHDVNSYSDPVVAPRPVRDSTPASQLSVGRSNNRSLNENQLASTTSNNRSLNENQLASTTSNNRSLNENQLVTEYAADMLKQMILKEPNFMPRADYMSRQKDINPKMRAILNDWLIEVHEKFELRHETLFLTMNITDRYLSQFPVDRKELQLVGTTAALVAAKFEEIAPPEMHELVYVTDGAYSQRDVLAMECKLLTALEFEIASPTAAHYLRHLLAAGQKTTALPGCDPMHPEFAQYTGNYQSQHPIAYDRLQADLAWYVMELALLEIHMIRFAPSHLASAALLLSNRLLSRRPAWPELLARLSSHEEEALEACAGELRRLLEAAPQNPLQAVRRRYRHTEVPAFGVLGKPWIGRTPEGLFRAGLGGA